MKVSVISFPHIAFLLFVFAIPVKTFSLEAFASQKHRFEIAVLTEKLENPWGMAFLPDGDLLVTERPGRLRRVTRAGEISPPIKGLPDVKEKGQGGLLGIALHPLFATNKWVYLSYTAKGKGGYGTEVARGKLVGNELIEVSVIFRAEAKSSGGRHFGSRLNFATDNSLYISLGERGRKKFAQDLNDHRGSLIRVNDDGSIPSNNPFVNKKGVKPEIFSYGHRNIQGMATHSLTSKVWTHEHGPQGGDEVNVIKPGGNYGWPVITYGVNYGIGTKIGEGSHKAGMLQPVHKWVPSIAPSGMTFYMGDKFPRWRGNLFVGSLKFGLLLRMEVRDETIISEERLLDNKYGRIRDVVAGPDGLIYLLSDSTKGKLLRLSPL